MGAATILQTTHWLPWGVLGDGTDCQPTDRPRVAAKAASLRRAGAHPHYAWLAALEETAHETLERGDWVEDGKAVG